MFIEKLLAIFRAVLSRFGFSAAHTSSTHETQYENEARLPRLIEVLALSAKDEPEQLQSVTSNLAHTTRELERSETDDEIRCRSDAVLCTKDEPTSPTISPIVAQDEKSNGSADDTLIQKPSEHLDSRQDGLDENSKKEIVVKVPDSCHSTEIESSKPEKLPSTDTNGLDNAAETIEKTNDTSLEFGIEAERPPLNAHVSNLSPEPSITTSATDSCESSVDSTFAEEPCTEIGNTVVELANDRSNDTEHLAVHYDIPHSEEEEHKPTNQTYTERVDALGLLGSNVETSIQSEVEHESIISEQTYNVEIEQIDEYEEVDLLSPNHHLPRQSHRMPVTNSEHPRRPRQPALPIDEGEFKIGIHDLSLVDLEYSRWNHAIVEHLILAKPLTEDIYLCVNPQILAWAFAEAGFDVLTPEQAEQRFQVACATVYRRRVLSHDAQLNVLRRCNENDQPDCTAFLAASVLAAYRMQSDEFLASNAYYGRLADLLSCGMQGNHPKGFDPLVFESLWFFLSTWLSERNRRLAMPKSVRGFQRFIALPLAHVPLRSLDIDKLPAFFSWARYTPGDRIPRDQLSVDLHQWQRARNLLTPTGFEALSDERSAAVLAQVGAELESWDGSFSESSSRRIANIELHFDIIQRNPILSYLPRRPHGFPAVFNDGKHIFEASDEGWYDRIKIPPSDGELLASGFEWCSNTDDKQFILKRSERLAVALTPSSSCSGFLSNRLLLRGVKCSVLCRENVTGIVEEYLSEVAGKRLSATPHPQLPNGWMIVRDFVAQKHVEPPAGLDTLEVDQNIELIISGGLQVAPRTWLLGIPLQIIVSGLEAGNEVKVNGKSVEGGVDGELEVKQLLDAPGEYIFETGHVRKKINIVDPQMSVRDKLDEPAFFTKGSKKVVIALPNGSWTLIGCSPFQVCISHGEYLNGTLAKCPFTPTWAVQYGSGRGARVIALTNLELPQKMDVRKSKSTSRSILLRWANAIYNANIRRPSFISLNGILLNEGTLLIWKQYASAAKQIRHFMRH